MGEEAGGKFLPRVVISFYSYRVIVIYRVLWILSEAQRSRESPGDVGLSNMCIFWLEPLTEVSRLKWKPQIVRWSKLEKKEQPEGNTFC